MPPEPLFSLCHLVVVFFLSSVTEGRVEAEEERQRRGEERREGGQIALNVT